MAATCRSVSLGLLLVAGTLCAGGCRSQQQILTEHRQGIVSLGATVVMAGDAWLSGDVSRTYTRITLERSEDVLAQQRADFSSEMELLATPDGAKLSQSEEDLSRTLAALYAAVSVNDAAGVRRLLDDLRPRASRP